MIEERWHRCAFLTMAAADGHPIDDHLAHGPLRELGIEVDTVPWDRGGVAWDRYDLVVVRSTWDYQDRPRQFLATLAEIDARTRLENELSLLRWNLDKSYLRDLAARGIPTIPTLWLDRLEPGDLASLLEELDCRSMVIKPLVGASAQGAWHLTEESLEVARREVEAHYRDLPFLAQAFVPAVAVEGEFSLIYFDCEFSHALLKTPKPGDFRSQEEHGGRLRRVSADTDLRQAGREVLDRLPRRPLYARVDLLRSPRSDDFWLVELELIEPSLYLGTDPVAGRRFATAVAGRLP